MSNESGRSDKREREYMKFGAVVGGVMGLIIGVSAVNDLPLGIIGAVAAGAALGAFIGMLWNDTRP